MAIIKKKTWPDYFEKILSGSKTFELRTADFDIQEGDTFILQEWDSKTKDYTGREIRKKAGFISDVERENCESKAFAVPSRGFNEQRNEMTIVN